MECRDPQIPRKLSVGLNENGYDFTTKCTKVTKEISLITLNLCVLRALCGLLTSLDNSQGGEAWQTKLLSSANRLDLTPAKPGRLTVTVPPMWTLSGNRTS